MSKRADGPWHVIHAEDFLSALREVEEGHDADLVYQAVVESATEREDYRESEGFNEENRLRDPLASSDPRDLHAVIEIQRNALEFLMRENLEKAGQDVNEAGARVDFLLSQPLG